MGGGGYMSGAVPGAPGMQPVRDMRPASQSPATTQPGLPQQPPDIKQAMQQHHSYTQQQQPPQQGPRQQQLYTTQYRPQTASRPTHSGDSMRYFQRHEHQHSPALYQGGSAAQVMYAPILHPPYSVMPQQFAPQRPTCYAPQNMILHQYPQNQGPQHSYYYPSAGAPLLPSNLSSPAAAGRNTSNLVAGPPPASPLQPNAQAHLQNVTAPRPMTVPPPSQPRKRISVTHPVTGADIDLFADQTASGDSSARQTPQPEQHTNTVAEEFSRMVIDSLNRESVSITDRPKQEPPAPNQEKDEPPVVSAISDSPIIVPKLPPKQSKPIENVDPKTLRKEECSSSSMEKHMMAPSFVPASLAEVAVEEYPPEPAVTVVPHQAHMVMPHATHMMQHQVPPATSLVQSATPYATVNQPLHVMHPPVVTIQPHVPHTHAMHAPPQHMAGSPAHHSGHTAHAGVLGTKAPNVSAPLTMATNAHAAMAPPAPAPTAPAPLAPVPTVLAPPATVTIVPQAASPQSVAATTPKTTSQIMPAPQPQRPKKEQKKQEPAVQPQSSPVKQDEIKQSTEIMNGPVTTLITSEAPVETKVDPAAPEKTPSKQNSKEGGDTETTTALLASIEFIARVEEIKFTSTQAILHQSLMAKGQELAPAKVEEPVLAKTQEPTVAKVREPATAKIHESAVLRVEDPVTAKVQEPALPETQEPAVAKEPEPFLEKENEPLSVKAEEVSVAKTQELLATKVQEPVPAKSLSALAKDPEIDCVSNEEAEPESSDNKTEQDVKPEDSPASSSEAKTDADPKPAPATDAKTDAPPAKPTATVLKYRYSADQWSPLNPTGKKVYDRDFLLQLQNDPLSRRVPENMQLLVPVLKSKSPEGLMPLPNLMAGVRLNTDTIFMPQFVKMVNQKGTGREREQKKPNMLVKTPSMKGSVSTPGSMQGNKAMFHLSLTRTDVKLNETENAWKPTRKTVVSDETQEVYRQFRGILNKLTPDNFNKLLEQVRAIDIDTQERLEGVIDLVFEKAIDEPGFSVTYANMCNHLAALKVQGENASGVKTDVNFRSLIINKCQAQFETKKTHARVVELEKELAECTDAAKKKELTLQLDEENRRIRMRSVGNVRFIGELYKLKMLTSKIMIYCLNHLIEKLEEEKLECLCKLLTTVGEPLEQEAKKHLDAIFAELLNIVEHQTSKISSRVKFMIQDVILLRRRKWAAKNVMDAQPKTIDQIQKEDEYRQRQIEIMAAAPLRGEYRGRDEGGRGKRDRERDRDRRAANNFENWPPSNQRNKYTVDTSKLKVATNSNKNLSNIKLGPPQHAWNHGSGAKPPSLSSASLSQTTSTNNMYSALDNVNADPTSLRGSKEHTPNYHSKGASIERSTFNSRTEYSNVSKTPSSPAARSSSGSRSGSERSELSEVERETGVSAVAPESSSSEDLSDKDRRRLHNCINNHLMNPNNEGFAETITHHFRSCQHSSVVYETYTYALEKSSKTHKIIANGLLHMVLTHSLSRTHFILGYTELLEVAPELGLDYPKVYDYVAVFIMPFLIDKQITLYSLWEASTKVISQHQGHKFLRPLLQGLIAEGAAEKWQQSGLRLCDWTSGEEAAKLKAEPAFASILSEDSEREDDTQPRCRERCPPEIQASLLLMMNLDRSVDAIRRYVQDFVGEDASSEWFTRCLIQAVCENALFGRAGVSVVAPRLNQDRMSKYIHLVSEFGADRESRDASCLLGVQQLLNRLEHPKGVTLEIFQYLSDHYIVHRDGFLTFAKCDHGPEGKGVLLKALVSFYTSLEVDNEDSCSED